MRTPLYDEHCRLGAKMVDFAGWEMPLYYSGIADETLAVRSAAGVFDLSHMGELVVSGPSALDVIQYLTTNDASKLEVGQAQYSLICNEDGGVLDDLIVYRMDADAYMLVVNAANTESDAGWVADHKVPGTDANDQSLGTAIVAVQGPASVPILSRLTSFDVGSLGRFRGQPGDIETVDCWVARTGYTGEDGFELYCDSAAAVQLWQAVLQASGQFGARPTGLGARDVLRLEAGYPLYGHELTDTTSPIDARLSWVVESGKGNFIGREAILRAKEAGAKRLLIGLEATQKCIPRHGYRVQAADTDVGWVTSGTFSPTLRKAIAMAYVSREWCQMGTELDVVIRDSRCKCRVVPLPFYRGGAAVHCSMPIRRGTSGAS